MVPKIVCGMLLFSLCLGCSFFPAHAAGEQPEFYPEVNKAITVTGEVTRVQMTNFPNNPWMETLLTTAQGERYVLIGKPAEQLVGLKVKKLVSLSGVLKPKMKVKNELVKVIDVKNITKIEDVKEEPKQENKKTGEK